MTDLHTLDSPKMLRETLCIAQHLLSSTNLASSRREHHAQLIQRLIDECDRHRPLGPNGKHGQLHTATCGCEDVVRVEPDAYHKQLDRLNAPVNIEGVGVPPEIARDVAEQCRRIGIEEAFNAAEATRNMITGQLRASRRLLAESRQGIAELEAKTRELEERLGRASVEEQRLRQERDYHIARHQQLHKGIRALVDPESSS